jgi:hypothetical protein
LAWAGNQIHPTELLAAADLPLVELLAGEANPNLRREWWLAHCFPWSTHREELLRRWAHFLVPGERRNLAVWGVGPCGDLPLYQEQRSAKRTPQALERARAFSDQLSTDFRLGGVNCLALHLLLEACRADGVPVVLVVMPEGPCYRSWEPESLYRQTFEWLESLRREYGVGLVNALTWLDEDEFSDSHHLLRAGAEKLTRRLEREAILPRLQGAAPPSPTEGGGSQSDQPR